MQSFLSCIPEMICFDLKVDSDEFILLSTDGIFSAMDISDVVLTWLILDNFHQRKIRQVGNGRKP
jgi:serine/threonine protein phosphatase PrpC